MQWDWLVDPADQPNLAGLVGLRSLAAGLPLWADQPCFLAAVRDCQDLPEAQHHPADWLGYSADRVGLPLSSAVRQDCSAVQQRLLAVWVDHSHFLRAHRAVRSAEPPGFRSGLFARQRCLPDCSAAPQGSYFPGWLGLPIWCGWISGRLLQEDWSRRCQTDRRRVG